MNEKERRILREAMELEQEEGYIRDNIREIEKQRLEAAIFLRGNYNAYIKVGFCQYTFLNFLKKIKPGSGFLDSKMSHHIEESHPAGVPDPQDRNQKPRSLQPDPTGDQAPGSTRATCSRNHWTRSQVKPGEPAAGSAQVKRYI